MYFDMLATYCAIYFIIYSLYYRFHVLPDTIEYEDFFMREIHTVYLRDM